MNEFIKAMDNGGTEALSGFIRVLLDSGAGFAVCRSNLKTGWKFLLAAAIYADLATAMRSTNDALDKLNGKEETKTPTTEIHRESKRPVIAGFGRSL